jgi:hypothetical protein
LAQVQHVEIDEPAHDDMGQNDPFREMDQHQNDFEKGSHARHPLSVV